jgi:hypothetical protein
MASFLCANCSNTGRGACSRQPPFCARCCRQVAFTDQFVCARHHAGQAAHPPASNSQAQQTQSLQPSQPQQLMPEPQASQQAPPLPQQHHISSQSLQSVSSAVNVVHPSVDTMRKALRQVKPWQKGVTQDGVVIECRDFLLVFQNALETEGATESQMLQMIRGHLIGDAARWFQLLKDDQDPCLQSWAEFKRAALLMFGNVPAINEAWDAVQSCNLLPGETIETHLTRFNKKVLDLDNRMGVWMCYDVYIRKMRPETQLHLYSVFHDKLRQGERAVGISLSEISREAISLSEVLRLV